MGGVIELGGGERGNSLGELAKELREPLPERCSDPYWLASGIVVQNNQCGLAGEKACRDSTYGPKIGCESTLVLSMGIYVEEDLVQGNLSTNRQRWSSLEIDTYRFEFQWFCHPCPPLILEPVVVSVASGAINSVTFVDSELPAPDQSGFGAYRTVDELFDLIQDAIVTDTPHEISVNYDPEFGHPLSASIDYNSGVDSQVGFTVNSLEVLETPVE